MKAFHDEVGRSWVASAREEDTPRHHGRWYLVFHPEHDDATLLKVPEVRWQTHATAERTLRTMSDFELRRRLQSVRGRATLPTPAAAPSIAAPRSKTNTAAG